VSTEERLPEGWIFTTLGMLGEYINGYAFNDELWSKNGRPIIRIQDLTGTGNSPNYYDGELEEKYLVHTSDFLIAWSATLGAYIWRGPEAWLNQHIFKVVSYIDKTFHYYLAQSVINELYQNAHGSGMVHVTRGIFEATEVPLPPLPEQHRIVAAIEQQFTRLDNAVASLQSARVRAKQYRASLLKAAVEGELTKEWRATHPTKETGAQLLARILAERRTRWEEEQLVKMREKGITPRDDKWKQVYKEPQRPDVEQLPELPEGWCWAAVEQIGDSTEQVVLTGPFGSTLGREDFRNEGIPLLTIGCLTEQGLSLEKAFYISEGKASELERYRVKTDDILFSRMASVGRADLVPKELEGAVINYHLMRLRLSNSAIEPHYFISFIRGAKTVTDYIREVNHGVTRDGINTNQLLNLPIAIPPLAEQEQIVAEVEAKLSNIAQMEVTIENNLKRAEHERQSILREAFAGRLVPQDPEDEPASVLLERISEERKKREETEKIAKVSRKRIQMESTKKRRAGKAGLYSTLVEARRPLSPDDLFKGAGLKVDEQPESVEAFYEELHAGENVLIREARPDDAHVLLEALEPSAEVRARMAEEEVARQAQEAEQSEKTIDAPMLWNMEPPTEPRAGGI